MASVINYKFKSMKNFSSITIEGSSIPLWELKYEIINQRKMVSKDFDLLFYDSNNEKINDEYYQIERNSNIIVERIPLWMSSTGYYVRDKKKEPIKSNKFRSVPPDSYVCFRCGLKGHYIQHCPTNEDKSYDIARIRKPSGIPRDFLIKVNEGEIDENTGMLVTQEGQYVKAQPQVQEWKKSRIGLGNSLKLPPYLKCPICNNLFVMPVKTNCGHTFCDRCVNVNTKCFLCKNEIFNFCENEEKKQEIDAFLNK